MDRFLFEKKELYANLFCMKKIFSPFLHKEKILMSIMVTLKDGSEVPKSTFDSVSKKLQQLKEEGNFGTLIDLFHRCQDPGYKFPQNIFQNSAMKLKEYSLLDENEQINPDIQKIVLNSLEGNGLSTHFVDPYIRV